MVLLAASGVRRIYRVNRSQSSDLDRSSSQQDYSEEKSSCRRCFLPILGPQSLRDCGNGIMTRHAKRVALHGAIYFLDNKIIDIRWPERHLFEESKMSRLPR